MSQSEFRPNAYLIGWPGLDIIKIGSAFRPRRWKDVAARGGALLAQIETETYREALHLEACARSILAQSYRPAFGDRTESMIIISGGNGWTECFAAPESDWDAIAQTSLLRSPSDGKAIAQASQNVAVTAPEAETASEGRTPYVWSPSTKSFSSVMRRGSSDGVVEQ
jgi:hypothetical protein